MSSQQQIEYIDTSILKAYKRNSRKHSKDQIKQIARSIKEFGFTNPILIKDDQVVAGHGRLEAAKQLKLQQVPCIRLDYLTPDQAKAYVIADNQLALNADWDFDILAVELDELNDAAFDVSLIGFSEEDLAELIGDPNPPQEILDDEEKKQEEKETCICPKCHFEFIA